MEHQSDSSGNASQRQPPRWSVRSSLLLLIFLALTGGLYAFSWNGEAAGFLSDDAIYLLMADGFSPFGSPDPALTAYVLRETIFPPLYPMLLALMGAGSGSLLWAHVITTTTLILALVVYGFWIHSEVRDVLPSIGLLVIFALTPGTLLQNLEILSEFPFLLLSMLAIWAGERARTTKRGYGLAAISVGLATLTRTAGLSLLVAFGLWLFRHRVRDKTKWFGIALLPYLSWLLFRTWFAPSKGGYSSLWAQSQLTPASVASFLVSQSHALWQALLNILDFQPTWWTQLMLAATLLLVLPVWIRRLWLWRLDAWYLLIGSAMTLLYPFPGYFTRLFLPWVPIVLFYAYSGVLAVSSDWVESRRKVLPYAYLAGLFFTLLPSLAFVTQRLAEPLEPELASWKHTRYWFRLNDMDQIRKDVHFRHDLVLATRQVAQSVPQDNCVFGIHAPISMLYSRRIFRQPPSPALGDSEFDKASQGCQYFFLVPLAGQINQHAVDAFYPVERIADKSEIVRMWEDDREPNEQTAILLRLKTAP